MNNTTLAELRLRDALEIANLKGDIFELWGVDDWGEILCIKKGNFWELIPLSEILERISEVKEFYSNY